MADEAKDKKIIQRWSSLDGWVRSNMPVANSYVASDILLAIYLEPDSQVKDLFLSVPHSYTAVRMHYVRLLNEGWIEQQLHNDDKRVRLLAPSGKLEAIFDSFAKEIQSKFLLP